jgi:hypothetical protein
MEAPAGLGSGGFGGVEGGGGGGGWGGWGGGGGGGGVAGAFRGSAGRLRAAPADGGRRRRGVRCLNNGNKWHGRALTGLKPLMSDGILGDHRT